MWEQLSRRGPAVVAAVLLALTALVAAPSAALAAKPVWRISVVVDVPRSVAAIYGGTAPTLSKVMSQLGRVQEGMNADGRLRGTITFSVSSVDFIDGAPGDVLSEPHPGVMTRLVYEENQSEAHGGSFGHPQPAAILHSWPTDQGGVFSQDATDGLVHEFGHQRGAIDDYAQDVPASGNPVDGTAFTTEANIMEFPYGVHTWDAFAAGIINRAADRDASVSPTLASRSFPRRFKVSVVTSAGRPVRGATVELHPVGWYSSAVQAAPVWVGTTSRNGSVTLPSNPFDPGAGHGGWDIRYANFLVRATTPTAAGSTWMPVSAVGGSYYSGSTGSYTARVVVR